MATMTSSANTLFVLHSNNSICSLFESKYYFYTVGRGFPDRMRPPGDRYQEPPRDRGAPWDPERRREREHPRDRSRPHDESRDRDRRPRGELSPGRGPRHWEDKRSGGYFNCPIWNLYVRFKITSTITPELYDTKFNY